MVTFEEPRSTEDWQEIHRICCETGNAGEPIEPSRWPFFAEYWVGPYQRLLPEWTCVAREKDPSGRPGRIVGYLTGCPDTPGFEIRRTFLHRLPLLLRVLAGGFPRTVDARKFLRRAGGLEPYPETCFSAETRRRAEADYPAHFHVNMEVGLRGSGVGGDLVRLFLENLKARGVPGVHVVCGQAPVGFYRKLGFEEIGRRPDGEGPALYLLARSVPTTASSSAPRRS